MKRTLGTTRQLRQRRIRSHIYGTAVRPRLSVFRSLSHIYAQLIDDATGRTLLAVSDLTEIKPVAKEGNRRIMLAKAVGLAVAEKDQGGRHRVSSF